MAATLLVVEASGTVQACTVAGPACDALYKSMEEQAINRRNSYTYGPQRVFEGVTRSQGSGGWLAVHHLILKEQLHRRGKTPPPKPTVFGFPSHAGQQNFRDFVMRALREGGPLGPTNEREYRMRFLGRVTNQTVAYRLNWSRSGDQYVPHRFIVLDKMLSLDRCDAGVSDDYSCHRLPPRH